MSKNVSKKSAERERERVVNSSLEVFTNKYMNKTLKIFGRFFVYILVVLTFSLFVSNFSNTPVYAETPFVFTENMKFGVVGNDVKELQIFLNSKGYDVGIPDGNFGPITQKQVMFYQESNGLTPDGIIGQKTLKFLNGSSTVIPNIKAVTEIKTQNPILIQNLATTEPKISLDRTLKLLIPRMSGDDVKSLQIFLNSKGYHTGTPDGVFGPNTQAQVILFQKANVFTSDGIVGPITRAFINSLAQLESIDSSVSTVATPTIPQLSAGCNGTNTFSIINGNLCNTTIPRVISGGGSSSPRIRAISNPTISGVTIPAQGETPVSTLAGNTQYTATIAWTGSPTTFLASTSYTATITITPKENYTLTGVTANYFTVAGATTTNSADSGVVTAVFPSTPLKQLTISLPTITNTKSYNGNTSAVVTAGTLAGVTSGETVTVSAVATYDNKNVGTGKSITVVYTLGGVDASHYIKPSDYTVSNGVITVIPLTISNPTLTTSKEYDRNTTAVVTAGSLIGKVSGDDVTPLATATYDTPSVNTGKMITVVYTLTGVDAGNYVKPVDRVSYTGVITQKQLTISIPTLTTTKTYDQSNSAVVTAGTLSGIVGTEDVSISGAIATYDNANSGSGKTITAAYTITGADSANYIKPVNYATSSGVINSIQLTISNPSLTTSRQENGTTTASVTAGTLSGILAGDTATVTAIANYDNASVGTNKTITTVYTLGGAQSGNYTRPVDYVVTNGVILIASTIATPAISGVTVPILGAIPDTTVNETSEYTATISWNGNPATFLASTIYTAVVTITPKTSYTLTGVSANFFTVAGATTVTNSINSGVVTVVFPATLGTANYATPSAVALAPGATNPVGQAANSFIPLPNATNATGVANSWATGTKDRIKFTVTDTTGVSTITINGSAYTSGTDYVLTSTATPTIVVTTTENGKLNGVYTFTIAVSTNTFIGDSLGGGKVAYILQPGDTGYNASVQHGIIASNADISTGIRWFNGSSTTVGTTSTAIGTGLANTDAIIANQGVVATSYAAGLARAYNGGGYTDWYLPSKDELNKLYLQKALVGGFTAVNYWSSSEFSSTSSWDQGFNNGSQNSNTKGNTFYVRAIRAF